MNNTLKVAIIALSISTSTFFFPSTVSSLEIAQQVEKESLNWQSILDEAESKAKAQDHEGAIADYTEIIDSIEFIKASQEEREAVVAAYYGRIDSYEALGMDDKVRRDRWYVHPLMLSLFVY